MATAFFNPVSDDFHIKLCSATTLDEQVDVSTDHIHEFLFIIKTFHNICKCKFLAAIDTAEFLIFTTLLKQILHQKLK